MEIIGEVHGKTRKYKEELRSTEITILGVVM